MDNTRLFIWLALVAMLWLNYSAWLADRAPPPQPAATQSSVENGVNGPAGGGDEGQLLPEIGQAPAGADQLPAAQPQTPAPEMTVRVRTDVLDLQIDLQGGDLVQADLLEYPVEKERPDDLVRLLDYAPGNLWVFQTGLRSAADGQAEPNHLGGFRAERDVYELAPGQDELVVRLEWVGNDAIDARKVYTFRRGSYEVGLEIELENHGEAPWRGAPYVQMVRLHRPSERSFLNVDTYSFTGPVLYDGERYEKLDVDDLRSEPITQNVENGWLAGIQHHFLAAAVPPAGEEFTYRALTRNGEYVLSAIGTGIATVAPQSSMSFPFTLFVGPKLQEQLAAAAEGLALTVDYGVLGILARALFWVLSQIHGFVGNWGWSIIIVTLLIKLVFYKLTETSGRSMAKMRKIAPRMKALQERYKEDRQALSRAMMDLYKKEKINPAAGCLPILVQMPFFFAFYWVLIESVEMRQAPFMLWIDDLSTRDPYFVLPLLMGAAMFFQTRLNPTPPDPVQARVMQIMPIVFTVFFALFPSGLVLYWLTNTVVSIAQQWRINKVVEAQG